MKYAVFTSGGKQYKVSEGDIIEVELLKNNAKTEGFSSSDVLLYVSGDKQIVGTPYVSGVKITGKMLGTIKGEKIRVAKYKSKVRYRRITGHRHSLTKIQIEKILEPGSKEAEKPTKRKVSTPKKAA